MTWSWTNVEDDEPSCWANPDWKNATKASNTFTNNILRRDISITWLEVAIVVMWQLSVLLIVDFDDDLVVDNRSM
jgi:hypothetical protein